jgi:SH3-like domain-containing protein
LTRKVIAASTYEAAYPDPIKLKTGDKVLVGHADEEYPGWTWCTAPDGKRGWVPQSLLDGNSISGDYEATELNVREGEELTLERELNGWCWCTNRYGTAGWLPQSVLQD